MDNNATMTINKEEFEKMVYEEVKRERRMFYELCMDDYLYLPNVQKEKHKGQSVIMISESEWNYFMEMLSQCLGDLLTARELVKTMQSVYNEFHEEYERLHNIKVEDYIKIQVALCDTEDFEKVRDRFEEEFYNDSDERER